MLLHRAPAAGFDEPYAMLAACHERVERMLVLLERLERHLAENGPDVQARDVMRCFDIAAPLHHEDEERHVFPRLRALGQAALAERLQAEHREMAAAWRPVRATLVALAEGRRPQLVPGGWPAPLALYRGHLQAEDSAAYPAAAAGLAPEAEQAMGREMASRRGL